VIELAQRDARKGVPRAVRAVQPRPHQLTNDRVVDLCQQYLSGRAAFELAKDFGIHPNTVTATLKRAGVGIRHRGLTEEQIDEAIKLYAEGKSLARLGEYFDVDHGTVWHQLKKRGVKMRDTHGRPT
jgi:DNA-binding CsgD family transcriptional regulator